MGVLDSRAARDQRAEIPKSDSKNRLQTLLTTTQPPPQDNPNPSSSESYVCVGMISGAS